MSDAPLPFLPDVAEEHFDELAFLWGQRRAALRSPKYRQRELILLEQRIEAHLQGLLVPGERLPEFVRPGLDGDDGDEAFAAAYALLRSRLPGASETVWSAFESAPSGRAFGLADALAFGPADALISKVEAVVASAEPALSVAAAIALALRRRLRPDPRARERWLGSGEPAIRRAAWRVAGLLGAAETRSFWERGLSDPDENVRVEARRAALWCRQSWILEGARTALARGREVDADDVLLVAITGDANDLPGLLSYVRAAGNGPARFHPPGAFGHPAGVEPLLKAMAGLDLLASAYAGQAFSKITGEDIDSGRRTVVPPADGGTPDEFETEFLDEMPLPDAQKAHAAWEKRRPELEKGTRRCRGYDLTGFPSPETLDALDRESRWEACLRGTLTSTWKGHPADLEVFPQQPAVRSGSG